MSIIEPQCLENGCLVYLGAMELNYLQKLEENIFSLDFTNETCEVDELRQVICHWHLFSHMTNSPSPFCRSYCSGEVVLETY